MAKRTRAPARRGRAAQTARRSRESAKKTAVKAARKSARKSASKSKRKAPRKRADAQTRQATLSRRWTYTPELLAYVKDRVEQTDDSFATIGLAVGISKETVRQLTIDRGWKRHERPPHGLPPALIRSMQPEAPDHQAQEPSAARDDGAAVLPQAEGEGDIPPLADTVARLHRAVLDELAAIDALPAHARNAGSSVRSARTLASLTETLQKLQRMQPTPANTGPDDADMPADIDEFRKELARRIDVFVLEQTDPGNGGGAVVPPVDAAV
jgi:hypothetical protein